MAGGGEGRSLEQTPTWAVAVVCFCLILISIIIEHIIHLVGKLLERKNKRALFEALEKIKSELMLLGFISLLLTVGQGPISNICIPESVANTWHPCSKQEEASKSDDKDTPSEEETDSEDSGHRRLLSIGLRRVLAAAATDKCQDKGKVSFVSNEGIHQLHIFIFVLAVSHVSYCIVTVALGRLKMKRWKAWEMETRTIEYQFTHDPERFRFARDTTFGRRHLNSWSKSTVLLWIVSFFRQFFQSVPKVDYLTLRHGFITAHLAPQTAARFDFQKYINRSLEEDIKVVVGISPVLWFLAVLFILSNTHGWYAYIWLPLIPLIVILLVGTKLQVIITRMGLRIQDRGDIVIKGVPVVEPGDSLFWFNHPRLIIYLINFVLFENAFQLAFFGWTWYEFGLRSCYHDKVADIVVRITMGVVIQLLCSYVTLPLYALVTQMGSNMKPTIFNENVARALKTWHHTARKQIKHNGHSAGVTPMSSRPTTPTHDTSPIHLLQFYRSEFDNAPSTPRRSNVENDHWESEESLASHMNQMGDGSSSHQHCPSGQGEEELFDLSLTDLPPIPGDICTQHEIDIPSKDRHEIRSTSKDFSFAKR